MANQTNQTKQTNQTYKEFDVHYIVSMFDTMIVCQDAEISALVVHLLAKDFPDMTVATAMQFKDIANKRVH